MAGAGSAATTGFIGTGAVVVGRVAVTTDKVGASLLGEELEHPTKAADNDSASQIPLIGRHSSKGGLGGQAGLADEQLLGVDVVKSRQRRHVRGKGRMQR